MIEDHKEDVNAFDQGINMVKNGEMRVFAKKTLPFLKIHLKAAEKIKADQGR
jgi:predicted outer membrane protein